MMMQQPAYNRSFPRRICILALLLIFLCFFGARPVCADGMAPADVKAAFVLNFARFTKWPENAFRDADAPIDLYVYGSEKTCNAFSRIDGRSVANRKIRVRLMKQSETVDNCHMMYIDHDMNRSIMATALAAVNGRPVLTVGEASNFISNGGIINIFSKNERFHFEIASARAALWGLRISSRLLKLAIILDD